ncbi:MAG: helix-turn-helix transcriptional regulator [Chloroflexi bacterium]|nr:helix-turn-helix transcriptional regulator [Chloroflexota bacterium]
MEIASLLRRSRRLAGLTFPQISLATMIDAPSLSRYERGYQYPSDDRTEHILGTIARLATEGVGDPAKAAKAKADYEACDAGTGGSPE